MKLAEADCIISQAKESAEIINTTTDFNTFFYRYDFLIEKLEDLKRGEGYIPFTSRPSKDIVKVKKQKEDAINDLIDRCFDDAAKLKTAQGQRDRIKHQILDGMNEFREFISEENWGHFYTKCSEFDFGELEYDTTESEAPVLEIESQPKKSPIERCDAMTGTEFEYFCASVLEDYGFENVSVTSASGDFGADVLAERDGITYAVQCKCYASPVGNKAVQEVFSGKSYYNCMVGVVMTNTYFTPAAIETAKNTNIVLWDRDKLIEIIEARA
ncbi:restriction endonuclease [Eubacterium sp.]|uniref:restriction endonuclease n=1 Tax=Eubacterium sp. TaxID=142586 RepID=UPI002FC79BAF